MKQFTFKGFTVRKLEEGYNLEYDNKITEEYYSYKCRTLDEVKMLIWNMSDSFAQARGTTDKLINVFEDEYKEELKNIK